MQTARGGDFAVDGKAPSDIPALKPYWGKPAVRTFREDGGNVGIIRSPVRATALPGVKTLEEFTGAHVPKRQFEELVIRAAQDCEAFYAKRQKRARADPHTGPVLVFTVDGKGVVARPEDLREATQRAAAKRAETFTERLGRGRRLHAKRMASVAAIYTRCARTQRSCST
jgi:DNA repair exonuclease SbcCD nuclease subunit